MGMDRVCGLRGPLCDCVKVGGGATEVLREG